MKKILVALALTVVSAQCESAIYDFNVVRSDGELLTGTFDEINLLTLSDPDYRKGVDTLTCTIDVTESMECSELFNVDSSNYALTLAFIQPLTDTTGTLIDLTRSSTENLVEKFGFTSGEITVQAVPVPAAIWLFGTGLIGLVAVARRK